MVYIINVIVLVFNNYNNFTGTTKETLLNAKHVTELLLYCKLHNSKEYLYYLWIIKKKADFITETFKHQKYTFLQKQKVTL